MTSKLTREERVQALYDMKVGQVLSLDDIENVKMLARMALAAMNGEPFAYIIQDKYERERGVEGHLSRSHVSKYVSQEDINEHEITCIPLYRHAQQPVVPDDVLDALQKVARISLDPASGPDCSVEARYVAPPGYVMVPKEPTEEMLQASYREAAVYSPTAYRAMIAAAPQLPSSEPAAVPGKWIPVSEQMPDCWCRTCRPVVLNDMRFVVCPDCGNKRCPRANDHRNACTGSNEPGQEGSAYPAAPQEVKP